MKPDDQTEMDLPFDAVAIDRLVEQLGDPQVAFKWPARLAELFDVLRADFIRRGRAVDVAEDEARRVIVLFARHFGGRPWYLPRGDELEAAIRASRIFHAMGKLPVDDVAKLFDITPARVYQIYKEQLQMRRKKVQPTLF